MEAEETEVLETGILQEIIIVIEILQNLPIGIGGLTIEEIKKYSSRIIDKSEHLLDKTN